jgi:hypothetical protein
MLAAIESHPLAAELPLTGWNTSPPVLEPGIYTAELGSEHVEGPMAESEVSPCSAFQPGELDIVGPATGKAVNQDGDVKEVGSSDETREDILAKLKAEKARMDEEIVREERIARLTEERRRVEEEIRMLERQR